MQTCKKMCKPSLANQSNNVQPQKLRFGPKRIRQGTSLTRGVDRKCKNPSPATRSGIKIAFSSLIHSRHKNHPEARKNATFGVSRRQNNLILLEKDVQIFDLDPMSCLNDRSAKVKSICSMRTNSNSN